MPRLSTFLAWAKEHLARREARLSAEAIEDRFAFEPGGIRRVPAGAAVLLPFVAGGLEMGPPVAAQ